MDNSRNLYTEIYEGSLEQAPDVYLGGNEAVVCGDVLEHLVKPEEQLERLVKAQPNGCLFIISVPNVANLWVRLSLLFGHFDYVDKGILDRTHLHFYTNKSLSALLRDGGLKIIRIEATPIPLDLVTPFFLENLLGRVLFHILAQFTMWEPALLGYQFVVKAYKVKK